MELPHQQEYPPLVQQHAHLQAYRQTHPALRIHAGSHTPRARLQAARDAAHAY